MDTQDETITVVVFDDRVVEYTSDMLGELEPAYAMTVHKAQGSEYRAVMLAARWRAHAADPGVLYTAITRARELLVIVGDENGWPRWWPTTASSGVLRPAGQTGQWGKNEGAEVIPPFLGRGTAPPVPHPLSSRHSSGRRYCAELGGGETEKCMNL